MNFGLVYIKPWLGIRKSQFTHIHIPLEKGRISWAILFREDLKNCLEDTKI